MRTSEAEAAKGAAGLLSERLLAAAASLTPLVALFAVYLPDLGQGFVKDDFASIRHGSVESLAELADLFRKDTGFYRPLVSLSFALDLAVHGLHPKGYAFTNSLLVLATVAAVFALARALGLPWGAGILASAVWALNPHGISGLVLWISGRTAGLLTLCATLAALAFVKGYRRTAVVFVLLALFAKEEALLLPAILTAWAGWSTGTAPGKTMMHEVPSRWSGYAAVRGAWPVWLPLLIYLPLRFRTNAYLPADAPPYYRFTTDPLLLGRNVLEYLDRSCTLGAMLLLLIALSQRRVPGPFPRERRLVLMGLLWLIGGYGLTIFVPVRSSLYACFPLVGAALVTAALATTLWQQASRAARPRLLFAACLLPLMLVPLLRSRNVRQVHVAQLSAATWATLAEAARTLPAGGALLIENDLSKHPNLAEAYGFLAQDAVFLRTGLDLPAQYKLADTSWTELRLGPAWATTVRRLHLREGRLADVVPQAPAVSPSEASVPAAPSPR